MSSSSHHQQSPWGGADGIAYIQTTPLLQGKPVTPQSTQIKSPFMSADVQAHPLASVVDRQHQQPQHHQQLPYPAHLQAQQQQAAHHASQQHVLSKRASSSSKLHQLPIIAEQASNASISPSQTCTDDDDDEEDDDAISQTTSSYSSPSASTAANASSSDLRAYSQGLGEQPHQLDPSCSFQMSAGHQHTPGAAQLGPAGQQPEIRDNRVGTGGLNKSRFRGVSYDKKKRKWRVQIKVCMHGTLLTIVLLDDGYRKRPRCMLWLAHVGSVMLVTLATELLCQMLMLSCKDGSNQICDQPLVLPSAVQNGTTKLFSTLRLPVPS